MSDKQNNNEQTTQANSWGEAKLNKTDRFYKKSFFMPFGIFNTDKKAPGRAAEVLIGRNNERDSFIRRLLNSGKGGAYLVTGQRGTGKTSFVDHCMDAYEQDTVQRFANSTIAKRTIDKFMSFFFIVTLLMFPMFLAALLNAGHNNSLSYFVVGLPLIFFIFIGGYHIWLFFKATHLLREKASRQRIKYEEAFEAYICKKSNKDKYVELDEKFFLFRFKNQIARMFLWHPFTSWLMSTICFSIVIFSLSAVVSLGLLLILLIVEAFYCYKETVLTEPLKQDATSHDKFARILCHNKIDRALLRLALYKLFLCTFYFGSLLYFIIEPFIFSFEPIFSPFLSYGWLTTTLVVFSILSLICLGRMEDYYIIQPTQYFIRNKVLSFKQEKRLPPCFSYVAYEDNKSDDKTLELLRHLLNHRINKYRMVYKTGYFQLLNTSLLSLYFSVWKPIIKVKANLGFDGLDHPKIVYGLLKQIHKQYKVAFLELKNIRVFATKVFILVIFFIVALKLGDGLFAFRDRGRAIDFLSYEMSLESPKFINRDVNVMGSTVIPQLFGFQLYKTNVNPKVYLAQLNREPMPKKLSEQGAYILNTELFKNDCCNRIYQQFAMKNAQLFYLLYAEILEVQFEKGTSSLSEEAKATGFAHAIVEVLMDKQEFPFINHYFDLSTRYKLEKTYQEHEQRLLKSQRPELATHSTQIVSKVDENSDVYSFRMYHVLLVLIIYLFYLLIDRLLPILPYKANERKLRLVLDKMTSTRTSDGTFEVTGFQMPIPFKESKTYRPLDSRDVELHFLNILESLSLNNNGIVSRFFSVPTPDITIIFDELDKLGTSNKEKKEFEELKTHSQSVRHSLDLARSHRIKELLSDLKNVIDSQHCRFILIGGRHLRDEWLADQTKRDQLLPSIFDQTIYLSSLLTDTPRLETIIDDNILLTRIREYVVQQLVRAGWLFEQRPKGNPKEIFFLSKNKEWSDQRFVSQHLVDTRKRLFFELNYYKEQSVIRIYGHDDLCGYRVQEAIINIFIKYLAYRSQGIPKRLNEVFASAIMPFNRVFKSSYRQSTDDERIQVLDKCRDALFFDEIQLYRMQFTARLYDMIESLLGRKLLLRDDKVVTAVFFVTDFLLKFHTRSFDWDSLEKIDEIADINRAPDLRGLIYEIVEGFSQTFLHPVLNGMYAFRFKSNTARELIYMSKVSPTDSAAFNFTLDESQVLKEIYALKLETAQDYSPELSAALGELHEYDQDYDAARKEYYKTLQLIDAKVLSSLGCLDKNGLQFSGHMQILDYIENKKPKTKGLNLTYILDWAIFRLRMMLKVAKTYEHIRNFDRATAHYHEAQMLARRFLQLIVFEEPMINNILDDRDSENPIENTLFAAKNFNIFFQPVYAKAWLAEKRGASVDTSLSTVVTELHFFEKVLDQFTLKHSMSHYIKKVEKGELTHCSLAILKSELYNKAGDLCFFKALHLPDHSLKELRDEKAEHQSMNDSHFQGYLYQASYFYSCALHYLRYFNLYRYESSKRRYSIESFQPESNEGFISPSFSAEQLPERLLIAGASALTDLAETLLARVNIRLLIESLDTQKRYISHQRQRQLLVFCERNLSTASDTPFREYMVTSSIYFDRWLKYPDEGSDKGYIVEAEKLKRAFYDEFKFKFSLWLKQEEGQTNNTLVKSETFISYWFGKVVSNDKDACDDNFKNSRKLIQSDGSTGCSIERILNYSTLIDLSATYLIRAGQVEEAAYELRRAAVSIISFLENMVLLQTQNKFNCNSLGVDASSLSNPWLIQFISFLVEHAVYFIERSATLYRDRGAKKGRHAMQVKDDIVKHMSSKLILASIKLCTTTIKLSILWDNIDFIKKLRIGFQGYVLGTIKLDHQYSLKQLIFTADRRYAANGERVNKSIYCLFNSDEKSLKPLLKNSMDRLQQLLIERCLIKRFPVLNRLEMLEQLSMSISQPINMSQSFIVFTLLSELYSNLQNFKLSGKDRSILSKKNYQLVKQVISIDDYKNVLEELFIHGDVDLANKKIDLDIKNKDEVLEGIRLTLFALCNDSNGLFENLCNEGALQKAICYTEEMLELEEQFDSPMHFLPVQVGHVCFRLADALQKMVYYYQVQVDCICNSQSNNKYIDIDKIKEKSECKREEMLNKAKYFYVRANDYFYRSQQMYTMRHEYYKSISNMYYLYDDFNDRYIHHSRAVQIMGSTISVAIEKEISLRLKLLDQLFFISRN